MTGILLILVMIGIVFNVIGLVKALLKLKKPKQIDSIQKEKP